MRYECYKGVDLPWLREIPKHWDIQKGKINLQSKKELNRNNIETNILSLTLKGVIRNNGEKPIGLSPSDYSTYQLFEKNDLVFKLIDLNNIKTSRVGLVNERGIMSSAYIRVVVNDSNMNHKYLYYWYTKQYVEQVFNKLGSGVRETINKDELLQMEMPIPPLQEQKQIANFLDWKINDIDGLIKKEREIQAEIDDLLLATIDKAIGNVQCEYVKLKGVFAFGKGLGITKDNLGEEGIKCINYGEIHNLPNCRFSSTDTNLKGLTKKDGVTISKSSILEEGDFVFADTSEDLLGSGNFGWLVDGLNPIYAGYHTVVAKPKIIFYPMFMEFCLKSNIWRDQVRSIVKGVKVYSITQLLLKNTLVPLPEMDIQKEIADELNQFTIHCKNMKLASLNKVSELNQLKQSLISEVVTGKIDIRNIDIPEYEKIESVFEEDEDQVEGGEDEWD